MVADVRFSDFIATQEDTVEASNEAVLDRKVWT